jgi:uncharacterized protein DUF4190
VSTSDDERGGRDFSRPPRPQYVYVQAPGTNGLAVASLILGIVTIGGLGSLLAIIFGCVALGQIRETGAQGRGMAIAGIWLGSIVLGLLFLGLLATAGS